MPFEKSDKDFLDDDDFTKKYEPPVTTSFKVMRIASTSIYLCCPNPGMMYKKMCLRVKNIVKFKVVIITNLRQRQKSA